MKCTSASMSKQCEMMMMIIALPVLAQVNLKHELFSRAMYTDFLLVNGRCFISTVIWKNGKFWVCDVKQYSKTKQFSANQCNYESELIFLILNHS